MPIGYVLVCHSGRHVKHDDGALSLYVVAVPEPAKLLLAGSIPHIETYWTSVGVEDQGMHLDSESGWKMRQNNVKIRAKGINISFITSIVKMKFSNSFLNTSVITFPLRRNGMSKLHF